MEALPKLDQVCVDNKTYDSCYECIYTLAGHQRNMASDG